MGRVRVSEDQKPRCAGFKNQECSRKARSMKAQLCNKCRQAKSCEERRRASKPQETVEILCLRDGEESFVSPLDPPISDLEAEEAFERWESMSAHFQLQGQENKHQSQTAIMFGATNMKGNKCEAVVRREAALLVQECYPSLHSNGIPCSLQKKLEVEAFFTIR